MFSPSFRGRFESFGNVSIKEARLAADDAISGSVQKIPGSK